MIERDIIIIGGGAAGLMAAAMAKDAGLSVCLLEKNDRCGIKLLITGKGRCNLTNASSWNDLSEHIHPNAAFFKNAFFNFSNEDVVRFFNGLGLPTKVERGNRVFPRSDKSMDVLAVLLKAIKKAGVELRTSAKVITLRREEDGDFLVSAVVDRPMDRSRSVRASIDVDRFKAKAVILTTGGCSYPVTGSTGDGWEFARGLGHSLTPTYPALTAFIPERTDFRMENITLKNVKLDLMVNGDCVQSEFGEVTFTRDGIEGALGFRLSRKGVKALIDGQKVELVLDMKPAVPLAEISDRVTKDIARLNESRVTKHHTERKKLELLLRSYMPKNLILPFINLNPGINLSNSVKYLKKWTFRIERYVGYRRAVITVGGIPLEEVSRKTLQSKIVPNLFFAGEILNLDADTGGYNLQIAWSTAVLAMQSAIAAVRQGASSDK